MRKNCVTVALALLFAQAVLFAETAAITEPDAITTETAGASPVTLAACRAAVLSRNPLARERAVIDRTRDLSVGLATRELFPKVGLSAKATTQSDAMDISIPPIGLSISQDPEQYQVTAEISQTLYDGGVSSAKKKGARASALADGRKLDVDLDSLVSRVDSLFFGVILADAQLSQNAFFSEDLAVNRARVKAMVDAGNASKSDLSSVEVEILKARQSRTELEATRAALVGSLSVLIGDTLPDSSFEMPPCPRDLSGGTDERGEFALLRPRKILPRARRLPPSRRRCRVFLPSRKSVTGYRRSICFRAIRLPSGSSASAQIGRLMLFIRFRLTLRKPTGKPSSRTSGETRLR